MGINSLVDEELKNIKSSYALVEHTYIWDKAIFIVVIGIFIVQMEQALSKMYPACSICTKKIPVAILKNIKCYDSYINLQHACSSYIYI